MFRSVLSALFPVKCVSCGRDVAGSGYELICKECADKVLSRKNDEDGKANTCACEVCGRDIRQGEKKVCYRCSVTKYRFRKNTSLLNYREPVVRELTHLFKFGSNRLAGKDIARLLNENLRAVVLECGCDITASTPLSGVAMRRRGFNQVEKILDLCDIPYVPLLKRSGHTRHQSELNAEDRRNSIKGQFQVAQKYLNCIQDKKIMVVDDVYTTGSTVNEISGCLLDAGARSVEVVTFFQD